MLQLVTTWEVFLDIRYADNNTKLQRTQSPMRPDRNTTGHVHMEKCQLIKYALYKVHVKQLPNVGS